MSYDFPTLSDEYDFTGGDPQLEEAFSPGPTHQVDTAKVVFSGIICAVGLIGNLMVIFVILVLREYKKSVTHWYVLQLAIADSLFLLTLPFKMVEDIHGNWIYSEWMCKGKETLLFLNYYASILFLVVMSIDRYIAVCHTFSTSLQKLRRPAVSVLITAVTWLIALLMCIPIMLYSFKVGQKGSCICSYRFPVDETARCYEQGYTTENIHECLAFSNTLSGPEPHCLDVSTIWNLGNFSGFNLGGIDYGNFGTSFGGIGELDPFGLLPNGTDMAGSGAGLPNDTGLLPVDLFPTLTTTTTLSPILATTAQTTQPNFVDAIAAECHYWTRPRGWTVFNMFNFVVMFLIPFWVMVACYGLIIHRLSTTRMRTASTHSNPPPGSSCRGRKHSSRSDRDRRRVTIMCASLVACFVFCWLPFHAVHMAKIAGIMVPISRSNLCKVLPVVGSLLAYLNSALNPYLYSFLGTSFARRWTSATSTVRKSVKARTSSLSGNGPSVRFTKKNSTGKEISNASATGITKIYKKGEVSETRQLDATNISLTENQNLHPVYTGPNRATPEQNGETEKLTNGEN